MKIKTEIDFNDILELRLALNSLEFTLKRLKDIDKNNFAHILYETDERNLVNARKSIDAIIQNS